MTFSTSLRHTGDNLERRFRRHLGGRGLSKKCMGKKKLFWGDVNMKKKETDQMSMRDRDNDGNIVTDGSNVKQGWIEYFEWLLNVDDLRRAELT